jgi:very-short-patch-repair endonuclease
MNGSSGMPMYYGARPKLFAFATRMRNAPTEAELLMWILLNTEEFRKYKFRRQHPIARFIADFYSHSLKFVIEMDGAYHSIVEQKEYDVLRDEDMQDPGIAVLRLANAEILKGSTEVANKIRITIAQLNRIEGSGSPASGVRGSAQERARKSYRIDG